MLTISRKVGGRVLVILPDGREMWIVVDRDRRGRVLLKFDAPEDVVVVREEALRKKQMEAQGGGSPAA